MAVEAIACLRGQEQLQSDFTGAYLQGVQKKSEQVLARPPPDFREVDERGVEILWLMLSPLYGQADAGAIWNRTLNDFLVTPEPAGLGFERNVNDTCIYTRTEPGGGRVTYVLYVDDARLYNDPTPAARELAGRVQSRLKERRSALRSSSARRTLRRTTFWAPTASATGCTPPPSAATRTSAR